MIENISILQSNDYFKLFCGFVWLFFFLEFILIFEWFPLKVSALFLSFHNALNDS